MSELVQDWLAFRARLEREWDGGKGAVDVNARLSEEYTRLAPDERAEIEGEVARWLRSDDESLRFDAIALIRDQQISTALPELHELADRLETASGPGAPFERQKVLRLIAELS
jgi:hypothetical protein